MERFLFLVIFLNLISWPQLTIAQGNAIFPDEDLFHDLLLIVADPDNSAFVVRNRANEEQRGYLGDYVGSEQREVIKITYNSITLKTVEHLVDSNGNAYDQPTATAMHISWNDTNCYRQALPWLHGGWELAFDPDNSKTDWMFFNNKTCKFGLIHNDGRSTSLLSYAANYQRDGTFIINVYLIKYSKIIRLTVPADRSKIYNETGAYYTKFTDNFRDFNDKSNINRRSSFKEIK